MQMVGYGNSSSQGVGGTGILKPMTKEWVAKYEELNAAFERGCVLDASEQQLREWLQILCTGCVPNEKIRHRDITRGLTINHIQMARTIRGLEETMRQLNLANARTQQRISLLTVVAVLVGTVQAIAAVILLVR